MWLPHLLSPYFLIKGRYLHCEFLVDRIIGILILVTSVFWRMI